MSRAILVVLSALFSCLVLVLLTNCGSSTPKVVTITVQNGSDQSALPNATFAKPLVAIVTTGGKPTSGAQVTFTGPSSGAGGTFANGTATDSETTDASGIATSSQFNANSTAGDYQVTATVSGASSPANFKLTNTAATYYSFFTNGLEVINNTQGTPNYYALAGSVAIDPNGNVISGKQDYNDGAGLTSPQPDGDTITGGSLTLDANNQGTLTLVTNNTALGAAGTETLGVQFVNAHHAFIIQFDGSATSSGSLDTQTLPSTIDGGYALVLSGVDNHYHGLVLGGVFSVSSGAVSGTVDLNDDGSVVLAEALNGTFTSADNFGRGQLSDVNVNGIALPINYYIVGPQAIRLIVVDAGDSALGSAFGQGTNATGASNASLGNSAFSLSANSWGFPLYAAIGMLTPNSGAGTFTGVGDSDEEGAIVNRSPISGTYSVASNGYGNLTITNAGLLDVSIIGLYATDPTLNLLDPNSNSGGGGALLVDLDSAIQGGTGFLIPQTDTASSSFSGSYSFGAQDLNGTGAVGWEFDHVGQGTVASGVLSGTGLVNDAFGFFTSTATVYNLVPFSGNATSDVNNPGRYTLPLAVAVVSGSSSPFSVVIYQANGESLLWMDEDSLSLWSGTIQRQAPSSVAGVHAKRIPAVRRGKIRAQ